MDNTNQLNKTVNGKRLWKESHSKDNSYFSKSLKVLDTDLMLKKNLTKFLIQEGRLTKIGNHSITFTSF